MNLQYSRKALLRTAGAGAAAAMIRFPAGAAEFDYKCGIDQPATHPLVIRCTEAAAKIKADSGGRVELRIFAAGQLGTTVSMLSQVRNGALELSAFAGSEVATVVPVAAIENVAFAFTSMKQAFDAVDGPLGNYIRGEIVKAGLYTFSKPFCAGFYAVANNARPINLPEDLRGLKLRVTPAAIAVALLKGLGAAPVPLPVAETYSAVQTHLVDGAVSALPAMESLKYFEIIKYVSFTRHAYSSYVMVGNADAMRKLPQDLRDIVDRNINAAALRERDDIASQEAALEKKLVDQGMTGNHPNLAPFRAAVRQAGLYAQWKSEFGATAWSLLEKSAGTLS